MIGPVEKRDSGWYYRANGYEDPETANLLRRNASNSDRTDDFTGEPVEDPFEEREDLPEENFDHLVNNDTLKSFFNSRNTPYFNPVDVANIMDNAQVIHVLQQPVSVSSHLQKRCIFS